MYAKLIPYVQPDPSASSGQRVRARRSCRSSRVAWGMLMVNGWMLILTVLLCVVRLGFSASHNSLLLNENTRLGKETVRTFSDHLSTDLFLRLPWQTAEGGRRYADLRLAIPVPPARRSVHHEASRSSARHVGSVRP